MNIFVVPCKALAGGSKKNNVKAVGGEQKSRHSDIARGEDMPGNKYTKIRSASQRFRKPIIRVKYRLSSRPLVKRGTWGGGGGLVRW